MTMAQDKEDPPRKVIVLSECYFLSFNIFNS